MKLLIKFPTRARPQKSLETLKKYIDFASDINNIKIIVSIDNDDKTLNESMFKIHPCVEVYTGYSRGKIEAINRDVPEVSVFDILLLASDDMIPIVKGYDDIIRQKMKEHFPDTDGVLFFNDGYCGRRLNTLVICGSKYYRRFNYIYYPFYKSLFCDNEFMEVADKLGRQIYFDQVIIKHEHPANNRSISKDNLYVVNDKYSDIDRELYESRKFKTYDLSILICTLDSRFNMLVNLINHINKLKQNSKLSVEVLYDNNPNITVGEKRNRLLSRCLGRYCSFIDDDDKITDDYLTVIEESELKYDCIALNGMLYMNGIKINPFYHSLKYDKWTDDINAYYRPPNHLNPMRTEIAKQIGFETSNYHEDRDFSTRLYESKLIKTEYEHNKLQYIYLYVPKDSATLPKNTGVVLKKSKFLNKILKVSPM